MSSKDGSSGGSGSSGGGNMGSGSTKVYDPKTGNWVDPAPGSLSPAIANKSVAPMPVAQSAAPAGAYLGTTAGGGSLVSSGGGRASEMGGANAGRTVALPTPAPQESTPTQTKYVPNSAVPAPLPVSAAPKGASLGQKVDGSTVVADGKGGTSSTSPASTQPGATSTTSSSGATTKDRGEVPTTVNQKPAENSGGGGGNGKGDNSGGGPVDTTVTSGPRSDFSVVLAGQVGKRPDRSPYRSNNFVSLVSGAGSLGRKANESKRTLIGGA